MCFSKTLFAKTFEKNRFGLFLCCLTGISHLSSQTFSQCHNVTMSQCNDVTLSQYHNVTMSGNILVPTPWRMWCGATVKYEFGDLLTYKGNKRNTVTGPLWSAWSVKWLYNFYSAILVKTCLETNRFSVLSFHELKDGKLCLIFHNIVCVWVCISE